MAHKEARHLRTLWPACRFQPHCLTISAASCAKRMIGFGERLWEQSMQCNERKLTISSFVKIALVCSFDSCRILIGKGLITPATLVMLQQFGTDGRKTGCRMIFCFQFQFVSRFQHNEHQSRSTARCVCCCACTLLWAAETIKSFAVQILHSAAHADVAHKCSDLELRFFASCSKPRDFEGRTQKKQPLQWNKTNSLGSTCEQDSVNSEFQDPGRTVTFPSKCLPHAEFVPLAEDTVDSACKWLGLTYEIYWARVHSHVFWHLVITSS